MKPTTDKRRCIAVQLCFLKIAKNRNGLAKFIGVLIAVYRMGTVRIVDGESLKHPNTLEGDEAYISKLK